MQKKQMHGNNMGFFGYRSGRNQLDTHISFRHCAAAKLFAVIGQQSL